MLLILPYAVGDGIRFSVRQKDLLVGLRTTVLVLLPFVVFSLALGRTFTPPEPWTLAFQAVGVSLPEEAFFRGFLQERMGNSVGAVILVSLMFAFMHLPRFLAAGDPTTLLTFFPSLVMGYLYVKTKNVLPGTIFHFSANIAFISFF